MAYWLVKSEPATWSWDQQVAKGAKGEAWTGVRNFTARNFLKGGILYADAVTTVSERYARDIQTPGGFHG